VINSDIRVNQH